MSRSSEDYMEQVVEKVVNGDTTVEHCTISCSYSHSEVCSVTATSKSQASTVEQHENMNNAQTSGDSGSRPASAGSIPSKSSQTDQVSVKIKQVSNEDDRPFSAISNSSQVLETLKEDQDDDSDLPPSVSRASLCFHNDNPKGDESVRSVASDVFSATVCKSASSVSQRPPSEISACSAHCTRSTKSSQAAPCAREAPADQQGHVGSADPFGKYEDDEKERASSVVSLKSNSSANSKNSDTSNCKCSVVSDHGQDVDDKAEAMSPAEEDGAEGRSTPSGKAAGEKGEEENMENRPQSTLSVKRNASATAATSNIFENLDKNQEENTDDRTPSAMSARSNATASSKRSFRSEQAADDNEETEPRATSGLSAQSNTSAKSRISEKAAELNGKEQKRTAVRSPARSYQSNADERQGEVEGEEMEQALTSPRNQKLLSMKLQKEEQKWKTENYRQPQATKSAIRVRERLHQSQCCVSPVLSRRGQEQHLKSMEQNA
ncbi:hypothetical protein SKAU_G00182160 [Synaphobranchus kaupii]|uniref:Uncharacterized protein n=1 Tax=Synaphobranchus kaupii TaxID=118154 RepID=A0A9Q1FBY7_SYNKA|nr:hypothetical protein SKAU_G00182160 [Synaphobranchus kaupii]